MRILRPRGGSSRQDSSHCWLLVFGAVNDSSRANIHIVPVLLKPDSLPHELHSLVRMRRILMPPEMVRAVIAPSV